MKARKSIRIDCTECNHEFVRGKISGGETDFVVGEFNYGKKYLPLQEIPTFLRKEKKQALCRKFWGENSKDQNFISFPLDYTTEGE